MWGNTQRREAEILEGETVSQENANVDSLAGLRYGAHHSWKRNSQREEGRVCFTSARKHCAFKPLANLIFEGQHDNKAWIGGFSNVLGEKKNNNPEEIVSDWKVDLKKLSRGQPGKSQKWRSRFEYVTNTENRQVGARGEGDGGQAK